MKIVTFIFISLTVMICAAIGVADSDGLFWAAKSTDGKIEFYRSNIITPGAAIYKGYPQKEYLKIEKNAVVIMSDEEKATVNSNKIASALAVTIANSNAIIAQANAQAVILAQIAADKAKWDSEIEAIETLEAKIEDKNIKDAIKLLREKIIALKRF